MHRIKLVAVLVGMFVLIGFTSKTHAQCNSYFGVCTTTTTSIPTNTTPTTTTSTTTNSGYSAYSRYTTPNGGKWVVDYNSSTGLYRITAQGATSSLSGSANSLDNWVKDNAKELYKTLYTNGGDISGQVMGLQTAQRLSFSGFTDHIVTHTSPNEKNAELARGKSVQDALTSFINSLVLQLEYDSITINQVGGNAYNAVYGYKHQYGKWELGFDIPFSYAYISDYSSGSYSSSKGTLVGMDIFTMYTLIEAPFTLKVGADAIGSLYTTQNPLYRLGTVNYGGGPLVSIFKSFNIPGTTKGLFSTLDLSAGLSYQLSKAQVPISLFTTNDSLLVRTLAEIVEERPIDRVFTYGFNVGLPILQAYALNFEVVRSDNVSPGIPTGYRSLTAMGARGNWYPTPVLELNLGYRTIQDIDNFSSHGVILGGRFIF